MNLEMSLGELVKQIAAAMQKASVAMPFKDEEPWHALFYQLKRRDAQGKPEFLAHLCFNWDGPYPKCQELTDFLQALHWNASVSAANPHYDTITLPNAVADLWSQETEDLPDGTKRFLKEAVSLAKQQFSPGA